jgi:TldD protein
LIDEAVIARVLEAGLRGGAEFAEIFAEDRNAATARLEEDRVEELTSHLTSGAGVRVVHGETTGFAHTADLSEEALVAAARVAASAAGGSGEARRVAELGGRGPTERPSTQGGDKARAVQLLQRANENARAGGSQIRQASAGWGRIERRILVANSDGLLATDEATRTRFGIQCVASGDTGLQTGSRSVGRTMDFELFDEVDVADLASDAARKAITKLDARPAPSGSLPVVIAAGGGAVLFHEACGHPLEADIVGKSASVFKGRMGERVASDKVTLVDDGRMSTEWGWFAIDDEGRPSQRNVLIDRGVVTGYMWDFLRARKQGRASSGNGRRQTYQHLPMVRMSNTFLENGDEDPDEIIASTSRGVYIAQFGGGQVNPATGDFVFGTTEAYMIERGRITHPIRDANLIGNCVDVLARIDAVGNDFAMYPGGGMCGKDGQTAPVGMGTPTLRVSSLTIGGTARG